MKAFSDWLEGKTKTRICDSGDHAHKGRRGYENPCKKGHDDSGAADKEFCEDHSNPEYRSKKSKP